MRHFFRGSALVLPFYFAISFFLVIVFSTATNLKVEVNPLCYVTSKNTATVEIAPSEQSVQFCGEDFLEFLYSHPDVTILKQGYFPTSVAVYSADADKTDTLAALGNSNSDLNIGLDSVNDAMVSANYIDFCLKTDKEIYVNYNNQNYRTAGIFNRGSCDFIVPLTADLRCSSQEAVYGQYVIDAGENTQNYVEAFAQYIKSKAPDTTVAVSLDSVLSDSDLIDGTDTIIKILAAAVIVLLLNVFNVTRYWINGRKSEIFVLRLCGATQKQSFVRLFLNYFVITAIAALSGFAFGIAMLFAGFLGLDAWLLGKFVLPLALVVAAVEIIGLIFNGFFMVKTLKLQEENS